MYDGMMEVAAAYGGAVVGGDVVRSPAFFVTVALQGVAPGGSEGLMLRDAAVPGDLVAVTGALGASAGGLRVLASKARRGRERCGAGDRCRRSGVSGGGA